MAQPAGAPPAGSQINRDYQYEFRGLLIGSGTGFITEKITGLLDQADLVQYHSKAQSKHGIFYGYEVLDARTIALDVDVLGEPSQFETNDMRAGAIVERKLDLLANAFGISTVFANQLTIPLAQSAIDDPFIVKRPNKAPRQFFGHVIKRQFPSTGDVAMGVAKGSIAILCGDPLCYSLTPRTYNYTTGASRQYATTNLIVHNDGNMPSQKATIQINAPGGSGTPGPWLITNYSAPVNPTTGSPPSIRLNMTLSAASSDYIIIDLAAQTITGSIGGVAQANLYNYRRSDSDWWSFQPGDNQILITRPTSDAVAMTAVITTYDAWSNA